MKKIFYIISLLLFFSIYSMQEPESVVISQGAKLYSLLGNEGFPTLAFISKLHYIQKSDKEIKELNIPDDLKESIIQFKKNLAQKFNSIFRKEKLTLEDQDNIRLLIEMGIVNFKGKYDWTPLLTAAKFGHTEIVKLLIHYGANVNARDIISITALSFAVSSGHNEIVQLLIANGADINIPDKRGMTALMKAAYKGYIKIAELLINNGANVNAKDKDGRTALDIAKEYGHTQIAKLLESKTNT